MKTVFSNYFDSLSDNLTDYQELMITRVSEEIEASLMAREHPSSLQIRHEKYGKKIRELIDGLGEELCYSVLTVIFEDEEAGDSLQVRFKGRSDIRLNIYFDAPELLYFDSEDQPNERMLIDNEDEAYLSYIKAKQRYVEFGTLQTVIEELKTILSDGLSLPLVTPITL